MMQSRRARGSGSLWCGAALLVLALSGGCGEKGEKKEKREKERREKVGCLGGCLVDQTGLEEDRRTPGRCPSHPKPSSNLGSSYMTH